ncbi:MAG: N-acetylglucosaminyl-diphospho-decaprenol L-rhamnosyltransferase [Solirubrobacterales bacterium]|jgi:GT2 family glycosyltransferase|nr:N-acetylglucosaminyl-diphospho-decaprenol L-rhamnosyltransferase [Solirubrobacterales bacterium]
MSPDAPSPAIDVAIVNWNTARAALAAARAYRASEGVDARVTIVDNDSRPEQRRLLREGCPDGVRLDLSEENLGYGRAANHALRDGDSELVCVSNADVLPEAGALTALAAVARAEPRAGMVGPVFGGDTDRYHASLPGTATMLARIFAGSFGERPQPSPGDGAVAEVDQPSGACFVVLRETWEKTGGFDEGFFLWYEDVDLAKRLQDAGYRNLIAGSARVGHAGAEAFVQIDRRRQQAIRLRSVERYIRLHHGLAMPIAAPLLRLSRRLRAGGAR